MRRFILVFVLLLMPASVQAQEALYDAAPLLQSLRPAERRTIAAQAQVSSPSVLPFYDMTIDVADDLGSFELEQTTHFTNRAARPLSEVVFRVYANAVGSGAPQVTLNHATCLDGIACRSSQPTPSTIVVHLAQPLAPNAGVRLRMRLRGTLRAIDPSRTTIAAQGLESLGGLGAGHQGGDYGLLAVSDRVASFGAFHPVLARMRAGRWEQSDASTMGDLGADSLFHVRARIRTADSVTVVASGTESAPIVVGSRIERTVRAAFIRDFAFMASPRFLHRDRRQNGVMVRSWFVDGHAQSGGWTLEAARHALRTYTRRFGPYPYTELDLVEAPLVGGAGGVEFSGMVTIANMFYGATGPTLTTGLVPADTRRSMLEFVTAHEVAHQWWHGIVGSDSRQHPFQDECLAQYSAVLYMESRYNAARAQREADRQVIGGYHMMRLMGRPDGAVDRPVSAFSDSLSYAGLIYGKGPMLYRAIRQEIGDARFFRTLREYVIANRFRTAPPRALFDRFARGAHAQNVRALERRWLEGSHGDDDLGEPNLGRMLGGSSDNPDLQRILRELGGSGGVEQLLRGLTGGM